MGEVKARFLNIKFTRGDAETITPEQVWAELYSICQQRIAGLQPMPGPVKSGKPQVDIRKLVEGL